MSQHDFDIANQAAAPFRTDLNAAFQAAVSLNGGPTAPTTTYAGMPWRDTANELLKIRSDADDAWVTVGKLDQTAGEFRLLVAATTDIRASLAEAQARTDNTKVMTALRADQLVSSRVQTVQASGGNESGLGTSPTQRLSVTFTATSTKIIANASMRIAKSNSDGQTYNLDFRLYHGPTSALIGSTVSAAYGDVATSAAVRIDANLASSGLTVGDAHRLEIWTYQNAATGTAFPSGMVISGFMA